MASAKDLVQQLRVTMPCNADWDAMEGNEQRRFCKECRQHVYNVSAMTEEQAVTLLDGTLNLCVRFYRRNDGTVVTGDCSKSSRSRLAGIAIGVLAGTIVGLAATPTMGAPAPLRARRATAPAVGPEVHRQAATLPATKSEESEWGVEERGESEPR